MILTLDEWQTVLRNSSFFNGCGFGINSKFWHYNLRNFGTTNILLIFGLGHLAQDYGNNVGAALEDPAVRKQIEFALAVRSKVDETALAETDADCLLKKEISERVALYKRWRQLLLTEDERRAYIHGMNTAGTNGSPIWSNVLDRSKTELPTGAQQSLSDSIHGQVRRRGPVNHANGGQSNSLKRRRCKHCGETDHCEKECPKGGYMHRGLNGEPVPISMDSAPRCFVCGQRNRVLNVRIGQNVHHIYHCSSNCPFRHPFSFGEVWRRCGGCKGHLQACWNCAEPSCLHQTTPTCNGHRLNRCPKPRYWPSLDEASYGFGVERRLLPHELLRELNIVRLPREQLGAKVGEIIRQASVFNQFDAHQYYRQSLANFCTILKERPNELQHAEREFLASRQMVLEIDPEFTQMDISTGIFDAVLPELCQLCCQRKKGALLLRLLCCPIDNGELRTVHSDCLKQHSRSAEHGMILCPFCGSLQHVPSLCELSEELDIGQEEELHRLHRRGHSEVIGA